MVRAGRAVIWAVLGMCVLALCGCPLNGSSGGSESSTVQVSGQVFTPQREVIAGAEVYNDDGLLATTDTSGQVQLALAPEKATSLRLYKPGYATQTVVLKLRGNQASFVATMGQRTPPVTLNADAAIDTTGLSGARVEVPAGALVDTNGHPVTGSVQLNMTPVDVSDDDEAELFPGAFAGTDINGNPAPLIMSYGTVEYFFSQNGEELNLAPGQSATIEIPVFVTTHPDGSPIQIGDAGGLWYLDEASGQWTEENTGIVVESTGSPTGMALRAEVTHFSWWNHDVAPELCDLTILPSGVPEDAEVTVKAWTSQPRTGITSFPSSGSTEIVPRDTPVIYTATADASDGFYYGSAGSTCGAASGTLILEFQGPRAPIIREFAGRVVPIFERASPSDPWDVVGNDAIFNWRVLGGDNLLLSSDQGHATTLGNRSGSTQFPLDLNGTHAASYIFTLRAEDSESSDSKFVTLEYVEAHDPIVNSFSVDLTAKYEHASIYWDVTAADTVNITYQKFDLTQPIIVFAEDQGLDPDDGGAINIPMRFPLFTEQGAGHYFVNVQFVNQYGSNTQSFVVYASDPNVVEPPPGGEGTDGPPL